MELYLENHICIMLIVFLSNKVENQVEQNYRCSSFIIPFFFLLKNKFFNSLFKRWIFYISLFKNKT